MRERTMMLIGVVVVFVVAVGVCGYIDATSTPSSDDADATEDVVLDNLGEDNMTDENATEEVSSDTASSDSSSSGDSSSSSSSSSGDQSSSSSSSGDSGSSSSQSSSSSSSSSDDDYYYSPQHDDYITEWTDSDGVQHTKNKEGTYSSSYDSKTGIETSTVNGTTYHDKMG